MARPFRFAVQSFSAASGSEWRERARRVEGLGYSALHLADHVIGPWTSGGKRTSIDMERSSTCTRTSVEQGKVPGMTPPERRMRGCRIRRAAGCLVHPAA